MPTWHSEDAGSGGARRDPRRRHQLHWFSVLVAAARLLVEILVRMNKGRCIGGPHDGDIAECDGNYFNVELKVGPILKNPDGTVSRVIEYDTYRWDGECWRWGSQ
jgi:hypothetical protein